MYKTKTEVSNLPQRTKTESEWYVVAHTCIWMIEYNVVKVPFGKDYLVEAILLPNNLYKAYKLAIPRNSNRIVTVLTRCL